MTKGIVLQSTMDRIKLYSIVTLCLHCQLHTCSGSLGLVSGRRAPGGSGGLGVEGRSGSGCGD